ncbi:9887_t:CDS:2, partial [Gigaspora rosea]
KADGHVEHDPCISHCFPYAFDECIDSHERRCPDYLNKLWNVPPQRPQPT